MRLEVIHIMNKHIIHIYGASGSGTSTMGRLISEKLGYFFMDTDNYYWEATDPPYQIKRNVLDRIALMKNDIAQHDKIVISGSLADWGDELIPLFTLAIRIETDTAIRIDRLKKREREHFGSRIDMGGDMYEHHKEFLDWAALYDTGNLDMRSKAKHDEWEKQLQCPIILLDGSLPIEKNFETIRQHIYRSEKRRMIHLAAIADLETVLKITRETISEIYPKYYAKGVVEFFLQHHNSKNILEDINGGHVWLLEDGGHFVGTVTIKENCVFRLFVLPAFQSQGFGSYLMDFAEEKIAEKYAQAHIDTSLAAKEMYLKRGYKEKGTCKIVADNGDILVYDEMEKSLKKA